ncbi:MAG: ABC transporter permease [Candidatus Rokubacteria bacterium]|nr:ABC transporter permease [Candidatus Rokubacteria bacterium]
MKRADADPVVRLTETAPDDLAAVSGPPGSWLGRVAWRNPTASVGLLLLTAMTAVAVLAPWLGTLDPVLIDPLERLRPPSAERWFGTDMFGRDVYSRTLYGARVSLFVGASVAMLSVVAGSLIGLAAGFNRRADAIVMRVMDGMMAIPAILVAIALMTLSRPGVRNVIAAITIAEMPRVVRLVRSLVLSIRERVYVEAAIATGARLPRLLLRHVLPNTVAPVVVQATYVFAAAVLVEAGLSFLGAGTPPQVPSWGNIVAEGRIFFRVAFWIILFPGLALSATVLSINLLGDGLRAAVDPRLARRM